jgi:DNA polymerase III delta prime subunit
MANTFTFRERLNNIMAQIGYSEEIHGKSNEEVIQMIERSVISLEEIDENIPYEYAKEELYDAFWEKNWVRIDLLISDCHLEQMYNLLTEFKKAN